MKLSSKLVCFFILITSLCFESGLLASPLSKYELEDESVLINFRSNDFENYTLDQLPNPIWTNLNLLKFKSPRNRKLIAALLAFPFPFGIVGLHRIYLGTDPHVPVVYIGTLGGGFGLIPLIDFFAILFVKDIDRYVNNKQVFMWVN